MAGTERFDPYRILGVRRDATPVQLARAYRLQAKRLHPDLHGPDAERLMRDLNRSWQILSDPGRRAAWDAGHPSATAVRHWSASTGDGARTSVAPSAPSPASRTAFETAGAVRGNAGMRVRVADAWPRPRAPLPAERGLRDSGWLAAAVAVALVIVLVVLGWVASTARGAATPAAAYRAIGFTPVASLTLDPANVVSLYRAGAERLGVMRASLDEQGWWQATLIEERDIANSLTVRLVTDDSGSGWRSVVFGTAPDGVERVRLAVASVGGDVSDGLWLMGVRGPLRADQLRWAFEGPDGTVLVAGSGELH